MLLCLAAAWPVGRFVLRFRGFDAFALEWHRSVPLWLLGAIVLATSAKLLSVAAGVGLGAYSVQATSEQPDFASAAPLIALALISTFVPSVAEDIITRGFWWRVPWRALRGATFVLITSAIYVLNHLYRLGNGPTEWLMLFCFGLAYGVAIMKTGSLWTAVGVHWGWNLTNEVLGHFARIEVMSSNTPFISAAAHLAMAALMLLLPRREMPDGRCQLGC